MMRISELTVAIDSMGDKLVDMREKSFSGALRFFRFKDDFQVAQVSMIDQQAMNSSALQSSSGGLTAGQATVRIKTDSTRPNEPEKTVEEKAYPPKRNVVKAELDTSAVQVAKMNPLDTLDFHFLDSVVQERTKSEKILVTASLQQARNVKNTLSNNSTRVTNLSSQMNRYKVEKYKKYSQAFACLVMFLIGAPLGSIIKKGGLGVPVIISVFFFIIYYVLSISGEEYAKADVMDGRQAVWIANMILFPVGLFFLRQARIDARLFDKDIYIIWWDKMIEKYVKKKKIGKSVK